MPAPPPAPLLAPDTARLIPPEVREAIVNHARWCYPAEACGLLAVDGTGDIVMVYPLTNIDASPVRFTIDPREHFGAVNHAETHGWEIGGVFHSHPDGGPNLSPVDLAAEHPEGWIQIVVGFIPTLELRAFCGGQSGGRTTPRAPT